MTRGPAPKRSAERRRRNKVGIDQAPATTGSPLGPECPNWVSTGLARSWYESLRTSGQAVWYTDSDWAYSVIVCLAIMTFEETPTAAMFRQIVSAQRSLASTEGDRRSLRIELTHLNVVDEDELASAAALEEFRRNRSNGLSL